MILGIDEAGRGPVIGPMVMAGVLIDESYEDKLKEMGITDSKQISKKRREKIYEDLIKDENVKYQIETIEPIDIDTKEERNMNLNDLEAYTIAKLIYDLKPTKVYADCPSINPVSFNQDLLKYIKQHSKDDPEFQLPEIVCEHKADINYISSSAASILAKVKRDKIINSYKEEFEVNTGSGYPSDKFTIQFLKENIENPKYRHIIRMSWGTAKKLLSKDNQQTLL